LRLRITGRLPPLRLSAQVAPVGPVCRREFREAASENCRWPTVLLAAKTYGSVFYDKLTPLDSSGKMVGSIRNHVAMEQWGDASRVFNGNGGARLPESLEDSGNLERVPNQDGVGYQTQAARLVHDLIWRASRSRGSSRPGAASAKESVPPPIRTERSARCRVWLIPSTF
jgi:hypothetical protein